MIKSLFIVLFLYSFNFAFTQESTCENRLDSIKVIKIAKRHNAYWISKNRDLPALIFDKQNCTWTVVSTISRHTNRGNCKRTNGCTFVKKVTLVVNAHSKKVISKAKWQKLYPNYE
jgi:hypothetical protein